MKTSMRYQPTLTLGLFELSTVFKNIFYRVINNFSRALIAVLTRIWFRVADIDANSTGDATEEKVDFGSLVLVDSSVTRLLVLVSDVFFIRLATV